MKKIELIFVLLLVVLLTACSEERDARNTAEEYMDAVKMGEDYEYIEAREGFIDLFDYEYLQTLEAPEEKDTVSYERRFWEDFYKEEYPTFEEYKEFEKGLRDDYEVLSDTSEELVLWDGEYKELHRFLYNVEIANEAGKKIFKKAEITVENGTAYIDGELEDAYIITDIYLR